MSRKELAVAGLALGLALVALPVDAQVRTVHSLCVQPTVCIPLGEALYLADNNGLAVDGNGSDIFAVHIDPAHGRANLEFIANVPYDNVLAIAGTPDGQRLYVFDSLARGWEQWTTAGFGFIDLSNRSFHHVGQVTWNGSPLPAVVLAGFSPNGTLYLGSELNDTGAAPPVDYRAIYTLNKTTGEATRVGVPYMPGDVAVGLKGADLAFGADGTAYLWTNVKGASGLYSLSLPGSGGKIPAAFRGGMPGSSFTGIAIRANGMGCLTGSVLSSPSGMVHSQDLATAANNAPPYPMYLDGNPYEYPSGGDMSNGASGVVCTRTIGWYKNHDWNYGSPDLPASLVLCGIGITQNGDTSPFSEAGQAFLNGEGYDKRPNATDFSMLIAQLIAAKLNTGGSACVSWMSEIEEWLCNQGIVLKDGDDNPVGLDFHKKFASFCQMLKAHVYACQLARFNETNEKYCCDSGGKDRDCH